jgi:hypothetical protein
MDCMGAFYSHKESFSNETFDSDSEIDIQYIL